MCGIAGIFHYNKSVIVERIKTMTDELVHRGPDGEGQWISPKGELGLGHRRLSIIDLSENGKQPMHYLNRYTIVLNGEIYNYLELKEQLLKKGYRFRSKTDTEVLLALYDLKKEKCLDDLDGMFAFALWDEEEQTLFCARDRFGEKPFFYHVTKEEFIFASEIKALFKAGIKKEISNTRLINYIVTDAIEDIYDKSTTFYEGIYNLEAGHYLKISANNFIKKKYYQLNYSISHQFTFERACEEFHSLFQNSVQLRTNSSDVKVGTSLSGGIDSSLIFHEINQLNAHVNSFTASFPGFKKDETELVQLLQKNYNANAHFTYPTAEGYVDELDTFFYHQDEPVKSANMYAQYCVFKLARENGVTVLLDGQGADEVFAGYHLYYPIYLQELLTSDKKKYQEEINFYLDSPYVNTNFFFYLEAYAPRLFYQYKKLRGYHKAPVTDIHPEYYASFKHQLFKPKYLAPKLNDSLEYNLFYSGFEHLLRYGDRSSMAFSREVRLPFLSHHLVEFACSLPIHFKINKGFAKYIERYTYQHKLPEEIIWKKEKIGYEAPQANWVENKKLQERIAASIQYLIEKKILAPNHQLEKKWWRYIQIAKLLGL